jgi:MFS family permease
MLLAGFALLGLAVGIFTASDWALAIDLIPDPRMPGLYMGLTNLATAGGDALASFSAGVVLDSFNRMQPLLGYSAVFVMMACYFALSSVALLKVPRTAVTHLRGKVAPTG